MLGQPVFIAGQSALRGLKSACRGLVLVLVAGCTGLPDGVRPVDGFEVERYLGTWYEIARLDHSFERGLSRVTASYRLRDEGGIEVVNRGYSAADDEWSQADGVAHFVGEPQAGHLKVSFFGPFYGSYIIFELDPAYRYAFVSGYNTDYLWLLARAPAVSPEIKTRFEARAAELGFNIDELIYVEHN